MKLAKYILALGLPIVLNACTSVTVIPSTGNMLTVEVSDSSEKKALKLATTKAKRICQVENRSLTILDAETVYLGVDNNQQALIKLAKNILPADKTTGPFIPENYNYKTTITFRCQ